MCKKTYTLSSAPSDINAGTSVLAYSDVSDQFTLTTFTDSLTKSGGSGVTQQLYIIGLTLAYTDYAGNAQDSSTERFTLNIKNPCVDKTILGLTLPNIGPY